MFWQTGVQVIIPNPQQLQLMFKQSKTGMHVLRMLGYRETLGS